MPWTLVVSIVALIVTLLGVSWKLSASITENTTAVRELRDKFDNFSDKNDKDHARYDTTLNDHEKRITIIEHTN